MGRFKLWYHHDALRYAFDGGRSVRRVGKLPHPLGFGVVSRSAQTSGAAGGLIASPRKAC